MGVRAHAHTPVLTLSSAAESLVRTTDSLREGHRGLPTKPVLRKGRICIQACITSIVLECHEEEPLRAEMTAQVLAAVSIAAEAAHRAEEQRPGRRLGGRGAASHASLLRSPAAEKPQHAEPVASLPRCTS